MKKENQTVPPDCCSMKFEILARWKPVSVRSSPCTINRAGNRKIRMAKIMFWFFFTLCLLLLFLRALFLTDRLLERKRSIS